MKDEVLNILIKEKNYQNFKKQIGKKNDYFSIYELEMLQKYIEKF